MRFIKGQNATIHAANPLKVRRERAREKLRLNEEEGEEEGVNRKGERLSRVATVYYVVWGERWL